jgi:hypothetical protein
VDLPYKLLKEYKEFHDEDKILKWRY